jgi:hypothetical protein
LIPLLRDADEWTAVTFARLILSVPKVIHEGLVLGLRDRLLGAVPDGRWRTLDHLERPAAYCYEALRGCGQGYGGGSGYPYPDPADEVELDEELHDALWDALADYFRASLAALDRAAAG